MKSPFKFEGKIVEFYPYETGMVFEPTLEINLFYDFKGELIPNLYEAVSKFVTDNGFRMDNKITFKTEGGLCFTYWDHKLTVGSKIRMLEKLTK